jgi:hypothetical protein
MKLRLIIALGVIGLFLASCAKDNYSEPGSKFEGKLVYKGEAVNVSYNDVTFQLWEPGWQKKGEINVAVDQDGTYSSMLFNANYKLVIPKNQGPFMSPTNAETKSDTILVNLSGSKVMDIEVMPDANAKNIERVNLYVNKTQFVDFRSNVASAELAGASVIVGNTITLKATVPAITPTQNYVFARIGLKIAGVEDMIFSPVVKVNL